MKHIDILSVLAEELYGTETNLKKACVMAGCDGSEQEFRKLLSSEMGLVQDPITLVWFYLIPGGLKYRHIEELNNNITMDDLQKLFSCEEGLGI